MTIAGLSMQDDLTRMNTISQNLANVQTPGYKREIPVSRAFDAMFTTPVSAQDVTGSTPAAHAAASQVIDPATGALRASGNPLDVAIENQGFLEVITDAGPAYTRQGMLRFDTQGRLTDLQGLPIRGVGGEIHVTDTNTAISIDSAGKLQQDGKTIGQLKLVQFVDPKMLEPMGNGLFSQGKAELSNTTVTAKVKAGYLEASNVSSPQEMIRLTEIVRHFESMQKVFQGYDEVFQKALTKLGDF